MCEVLDPTTIDFSLPERRIFLDDRNTDLYAVVSEEDYQWAIAWRWKWKRSKRSTLIYAKRTTRDSKYGASFDLYLHIEIMKRADPNPPEMHNLVDHRNGRSLDCRRTNLRWATVGMNTTNRSGTVERALHG